MIRIFKEILQYRDLLGMLTLRDIRIRYKQASMGFLWAIFMPIVAVCAGILIKKAMVTVAQQPFEGKSIFSISVKVLPWTFFISSIRFAVQSLVGNSALITKIYFPRAILVMSSILACLFDLAIAIVVLTVLLLFFQIGISVHILWLPLYIVLLVLFTVGLGLILSAANLFFRDVKYVVEIILMFGIFFTPVFYDSSAFGRLEPLMLLNPLGSMLDQINKVVILQTAPDMLWTAYAALASIATFVLGTVIFHKMEPTFAENI